MSQPRIFLFSHPRTACHLLEKMLSFQPSTLYKNHLFHPPYETLNAMVKQSQSLDDCDLDLYQQLHEQHKQAVEGLCKLLQDADGKDFKTWSHDHTDQLLNPIILFQDLYGSNSQRFKYDDWTVQLKFDEDQYNRKATSVLVLPDDFLANSRNRFIFAIRHPLKLVPSVVRLGLDLGKKMTDLDMKHFCCLSVARRVYDWSVSHNVKAFIIDADDYTTTISSHDGSSKVVPSDALKGLASEVGFDPDHIQTNWEPATDAERDTRGPTGKVSQSTLMNSKGVEKKKEQEAGKEMVVDEEKENWAEEFGEELAERVEKAVQDIMVDYEYLWSRRVMG